MRYPVGRWCVCGAGQITNGRRESAETINKPRCHGNHHPGCNTCYTSPFDDPTASAVQLIVEEHRNNFSLSPLARYMSFDAMKSCHAHSKELKPIQVPE